jgi:DNA-binding NtrC family response regulator
VLGQGPEVTVADLSPRREPTVPSTSSDELSYRHALDVARAEVIRRALVSTQGNRAAAARVLGLHKTHLLNLMKSLRID